jgi:hypothetical protein
MERPKYRRLILPGLALLVGASFLGPAVQGAERAQGSANAIRLRWLPDCGAGSERREFSLEVRADGFVRYQGYDGTKIIGTRESRISGASAQRLTAATESFILEGRAPKDSEKRTQHQQDRYYEIEPRAVGELVARIRPMQRGFMEIVEDPPGRTSRVCYRYQPADVQAIKDRLAGLAAIEWSNTSDAANCEEFHGPSSAIHLREDLDIAE